MDTNLTSSIFHRQLIGKSVIKNWKTETLVQRLKLTKTFNCHNGCVNTIQFDSTGNLMISGSDDKTLKILDPKLKSSNKSPTLWSYQTNHFSNIFSASLVNGLTYAVSCSRDGEVRLTHIIRKTSAVAFSHDKTAYQTLSAGPYAPNIFFSCSDDKTVRKFDLRARTCYQGACIELNNSGISTIAIHPFDETKLLVGCSDDPIVKLYDLRYCSVKNNTINNNGINNNDNKTTLQRYAPHHLLSAKATESRKLGRVTCVKFNTMGDEFLASYSNEHVYIFNVNNNNNNNDDGTNGMDFNNNIIGYIPKEISTERRIRLGMGGWDECGPLSTLPSSNGDDDDDNNNNNNDDDEENNNNVDEERIEDEQHNTRANIINSALGVNIPLINNDDNDDDDGGGDNNNNNNEDDECKSDDNNNNISNNNTEYNPNIENIIPPKQCFKGHRNSRTVIKEATYFGLNDEYIVSGSDDGRIYFWLKSTGKLIQALNADHRVVNCVQRPVNIRHQHHPLPYLCSSGIDYDIKMWEPINGSITNCSGGGDDALQLNATGSDVVEDLEAIANANEKMRIETLESPNVNINTAQLIRMLAAIRIQRRLQRRREERARAVAATNEENDEETEDEVHV